MAKKMAAKKTFRIAEAMRASPVRYSDELGDALCLWIASGQTLKSFCEQPGAPCVVTIRRWVLDDNHPLSKPYAKARIMFAEHLADECLEIADDKSNDTIVDEETGKESCNREWVARSRLRIDTRKWFLSKICPKIYGNDPLTDAVNADKPTERRAVARVVSEWKAQTRRRLGLPEPTGVSD